MKTIAISIDEASLAAVDRLARAAAGRGGAKKGANRSEVVRRAVLGEDVGTWVEPHAERLPARKLWIAFGQPAEGRLRVDRGAVEALVHGGRSLLPVGVVGVEGEFSAGAAVEVLGPDGSLVAKGVVRLGSREVEAGRGTRGGPGPAEVIHRDDLVLV